MTELTLGVDIGGVLIGGTGPEDTSFFTRDYLHTPAVPGGFDALKALNGLFGGRVFLVSKCGPRVQGKSIHWLAHHGFLAATGVPESRYRFCLKRDGKAPICAELDCEMAPPSRSPGRREGAWASLWDEAHTRSPAKQKSQKTRKIGKPEN